MMTTIWSGLSVGALYAIIGLLLTIPMVRCDIVNFATPFYVVLGAYVSSDLLVNSGWSVVPVVVVLLVLGAVLGGAQEILTIRPLRGRTEMALVTTFGVGVVIEGFIVVYWGATPLLQPHFFAGANPLKVLGGGLLPVDIVLMAVALVATGVLQLAMIRTRWGILGRAAMTDHVAAMLRGVNIPRLRTAAFALSGALCMAFSLISTAKIGVQYQAGSSLLIYGFAAAAIGGLGSYMGCLVGGVCLGLVQSFCSRYFGIDYAAIVVFGILCAVMLIRPTGILGVGRLRVV